MLSDLITYLTTHNLARESKDGERDDLTYSEKIVNLILFGVLFIAMVCFIIQLRYTFKEHNRKEYTAMQYMIILMIFVSVLSR
jgi:hypothetical protein